MQSIHSMIQRFRENRPTPRKERQKQRQRGHLKELWWVHDESPEGKDGDDDMCLTEDSLETDTPPRVREKMWPGGLGPRRMAPEEVLATPILAVDKLMSEDIQMFLSTGGFRKNRALGKAPLVLPSPNSASAPGKPVRASSISRPRSTLVPASNRNTVSKEETAARAKHKNHRSFPQDSMSLDPLMYTGHAELRGETSRNRPRENEQIGDEHRNVSMGEDDTRVNSQTAAGVASDLDVVMGQLRNGVGRKQEAGSPEERVPRGDLPVSLAQIAHDLDAQLLEFTLMAKAREQAAEGIQIAEEAEKVAWSQAETKRVEEMVRQEHATLQDAIDGRANLPLRSRGVQGNSHAFLGVPFFPQASVSRHAGSWGDHAYHGNHEPENLSTLHPPLPPSALGGSKYDLLQHTDPPVEAVMHQMAGVLRSVEAKVKLIQAFEVDKSKDQEEGGCESSNHALTASSAPIRIDSPGPSSKESRAAGDVAVEVDFVNDTSADGDQISLISTGDGNELATLMETDDNLGPQQCVKLGSPLGNAAIITRGRLYDNLPQNGMTLPSEVQDFPVAVPQSWLHGQASLQQARQCISAELEVVMLCMQKRLEKQSICGDQNEATELADKEVYANVGGKDETEKGSHGDDNASKGGEKGPDMSVQHDLEMLADEMATRGQYEVHTELDRELGLDFRDARINEEAMGGTQCIPYGLDRPYFQSVPGQEMGVTERNVRFQASHPFSPARQHSTHAILANGLIPRGEVLDEMEGAGACRSKVNQDVSAAGAQDALFKTPAFAASILWPSTDASFQPAPSAPGGHRESQGGASTGLPTSNATRRPPSLGLQPQEFGADRFSPNRVQSRQQIGAGEVRQNRRGQGFAAGGARRRLQTFQTARHNISNGMTHSRHQGFGDDNRKSTNRQEAPPQPHDGAQELLSWLKSTRRRYSLHMPP